MAAHALAELDEGVLNVARMFFVLQVFGDLFVGKAAAKPSVPPKEEGHQDNEPGGDEKERAIARRHFVMRGRGGLRGRILRGEFRLITIFGRGSKTSHFVSKSLFYWTGKMRRSVAKHGRGSAAPLQPTGL